ncbi:hypothetical protein EW146_g6450 [Bondarzewia mesenterica]|uniref:Uncharacterized protein n=1 Tax=Bondarzewia mesenterica TaxID=1095465 RepID=A0A4S4LQD5_9AGAM|nr:hypothetical protein EW146_g6450 [Bondarzewia mesenterica]
MPSLRLLWPLDDLDLDGWFYGWSHPSSIAVAGVIQSSSQHDAEQLLHAILGRAPLANISCSPPQILGRCSSNGPDVLPRIHLLSNSLISYVFSLDCPSPPESTKPIRPQSIITYRRTSFGSLRLHKLDDCKLPETPNRLTAQYASLDTSIALEHTGLDESIINEQLNFARYLDNERRASKSWLPKLRPTSKPSSTPGHQDSVLSPAQRFYPIPRFEISELLKQISTRIRLVAGLPQISGRKMDSSLSYIQLNNAIWLILNDLILGVAFGSFVCENHAAIASWLGRWIETVYIESMINALVWLDNWPAGLKLNTELSHFCCNAFLGIVTMWAFIYKHISPHLPAIVYYAGTTGFCGFTFLLSLSLDVFRLSTVHASFSYSASVHLPYFPSTPDLSGCDAGKQTNVLHKRTDSYQYELDQLLLGTILFTLFTFSLPTLLSYYVLFAMFKLSIIAIGKSIQLLIALMNGFPLFASMLRVKDPARLPGSVYFKLDDGALNLKAQYMSMFSIFQYFRARA